VHYPVSKLTSKYQATVPEPIRKHLQLNAGDQIAFEITGTGEVRLHRVIPPDEVARPSANPMQEWLSDADEEAFRAL